MKYINMILAALMGISFALAVPGLAKDSMQDPADNNTLTDIEWEAPINPDTTVTVTNTVHDGTRHREAAATIDANTVLAPRIDPSEVPRIPKGPLVKTRKPIKVDCTKIVGWARAFAIGDGIYYLKGLSGKPSNGPESCGRVSCSHSSGIYWCNKNSDTYTLDSWGMIADGAKEIVKSCTDKYGRVTGESTYDGGWSVKVYRDDC